MNLALGSRASCGCIISTLTAIANRFLPGCIGGLRGAIGADDYGDVYSKPQCRRITCVPGLSL